MTPAFLFGVMFIAAVWAIGGYFIWQYGPGLRLRSVWCPLLKKRATIVADQREARFAGSYAGLAVLDVKQCSLLGGGPITCHRECIHPGALRA